MQTFCKTLFPVVDYAYCTIPTYPSGQIGFMLCSKNAVSVNVYLRQIHSRYTCKITVKMFNEELFGPQETNFREPVREMTREEVESLSLKYYNPEIHKAAFILPEFARKVKWGMNPPYPALSCEPCLMFLHPLFFCWYFLRRYFMSRKCVHMDSHSLPLSPLWPQNQTHTTTAVPPLTQTLSELATDKDPRQAPRNIRQLW